MQALKVNDWGAGQVLGAYEKKLFDAGAAKAEAPPANRPVRTLERRVPPDWTDYNNHMNEARYLQCFADASDAFLRMIGVDAGLCRRRRFVLHGRDPYPAHRGGRRPRADPCGDAGARGERQEAAALPQASSRRRNAACDRRAHAAACEPRGRARRASRRREVAEKAAAFARAHAELPMPEGAGRAVGQPRS